MESLNRKFVRLASCKYSNTLKLDAQFHTLTIIVNFGFFDGQIACITVLRFSPYSTITSGND